MFDWLKNLVKPVTDIVEKTVVDRDLKKELKQQLELTIMEYGLSHEKELTKRHELDMKSDSWLSKNIRPMTLAFLMFVFVIISFFDGNLGQFTLNPAYVDVYQTLLALVFTFYFGSRGIEKSVKIWKDNKEE